MTVGSASRHISGWIACSADVAYAYASGPANVPERSPGLGNAVERVGDAWSVESAGIGRVEVAFTRVLDSRIAR